MAWFIVYKCLSHVKGHAWQHWKIAYIFVRAIWLSGLVVSDAWDTLVGPIKRLTGWWFGCHFSFSHILGISSSQLTFIFFRGVQTTNQLKQECGEAQQRKHTFGQILRIAVVKSRIAKNPCTVSVPRKIFWVRVPLVLNTWLFYLEIACEEFWVVFPISYELG